MSAPPPNSQAVELTSTNPVLPETQPLTVVSTNAATSETLLLKTLLILFKLRIVTLLLFAAVRSWGPAVGRGWGRWSCCPRWQCCPSTPR